MAFNKTQKGNSAQNKKAQNYRTSSTWRLCNAHYAIMNDSSTLVMEYRDLPKREGIYGKTSVEATLPLSRIVNFADFQNKIISERFYVMSHHVTCSHRYTWAKVVGLVETAKLFTPKVSFIHVWNGLPPPLTVDRFALSLILCCG